MNKIPMTKDGEKRLKEELQHLESVERPRVIKDIAEARAHGDLKENAEYHAAREQQGFIEARITEIKAKLAHATVIDISSLASSASGHGKVVFGSTVSLLNLDTEELVKYQIVGEDEADIKAGKISVTSPIARAVIGKREGDAVEVQTPNGPASYEVDQVEYL